MILIIYANPKKEGHCATILDTVVSELNAKKVKFELVDLYNVSFDVKLKAEEEKKLTACEDVLFYQDLVKRADKLIFIYPIWWNNMPAILKGFMDRVFSAKFAFKYKKVFGFGVPIGLLKGKCALVFVTSGSPKFIFNFVQMRRGVRVFTHDILSFCGVKSKSFHHGKATVLSDSVKLKLERLAKKGIKWILK